ncbi:5'/3'-nucleotidase SurE [Acinetobacter equi]|uniref:5'-nucleotidase SurE n=1 Tax=Acinetobacter equi TaxID=1324350 RepID=A0A0N9VT09_9GAMM|nr:5'/3'-nucleotidase SurE [Acinetobacter equi]ALH96704.1 stationary phase survival protein SurE [Acinetobacter equi]
MNILISNDDGVLAPGIQALVQALKPLGRIIVVAPDSERSGFSSALTLDRPLKPTEIEKDIWAVNGTPADCVFIATNGLFDFEFDLVVSGINSGANLGDDILYSGTVGAAFEGRLMHKPALAISLAGEHVKSYNSPEQYKIAAQWVHDFILKGLPSLPEQHILNINIPDIVQLKGIQVTYQGCKKLKQPLTHFTDPRGRKVCWIGLKGEEESINGSNTKRKSDFLAISEGYVSITPIQMDRTNHTVLSSLDEQLRV